jgi:hypothetical protein
VSLPHDAPSRISDIDWRWALPRIALLFIVTRLLVLVVAVAVETTQPGPPAGVSVDERPIITSLTVWDGTWFLGIAEEGYHAAFDSGAGGGLYPDYAFYPLYPAATKAASLLTLGDTALAGILVANIAFALALVALYALSVRYLTPARALLSLWFLALAPGAVAFALSYSDSLFLLLAVGVFLAAELRHPWIAGIALALAALTRAPGLLLGLPLLVLYIERDGLRPTKSWIPLVLAPLALGGVFAYTWWLTGDPIAPVTAYENWKPVETLPVAPGGDVVAATTPERSNLSLEATPQGLISLWIGTIAFYTFLFVYFRSDRIRPAYWLVAILAVAGIFLAGLLQSSPRYLAVVWPFSWVLANRQSRIGRATVLTGFTVLQVVFLWLHFTWTAPP